MPWCGCRAPTFGDSWVTKDKTNRTIGDVQLFQSVIHLWCFMQLNSKLLEPRLKTGRHHTMMQLAKLSSRASFHWSRRIETSVSVSVFLHELQCCHKLPLQNRFSTGERESFTLPQTLCFALRNAEPPLNPLSPFMVTQLAGWTSRPSKKSCSGFCLQAAICTQ